MKTCDCCRWWDWKGSDAIFIRSHVRYCNLDLCGDYTFAYTDAGYGVLIDEGHDTSFATGPKFGCVHWKEKEE
jgi:hypothetical protein